MVPIYAIEAWLGLFMKDYSVIWDSLRECYEALVIYSFLHFLIEYLGGNDKIIKILSNKTMQRKKKADEEQKNQKQEETSSKSVVKQNDEQGLNPLDSTSSGSSSAPSSTSSTHRHLVQPVVVSNLTASAETHADITSDSSSLPAHRPPLLDGASLTSLAAMPTVTDLDLYNIPISMRTQPHLRPFSYFLKPWTLPYQFLLRCRLGIIQYVWVKVIMAIITFSTDFAGVYKANQFTFTGAYIYVAFFNNASQIVAMYCILLFYTAVSDHLKEIRPVPKFLCIKAVVFFTFWQSVLIAFLVYIGDINATQTYSTDDVATGIQDFCICIEMFLAAIAHFYAFPASEFSAPAILNQLPESATLDANKPMRRLLQAASPMDLVDDMKQLRKMEKHRKLRQKEIEAAHKATPLPVLEMDHQKDTQQNLSALLTAVDDELPITNASITVSLPQSTKEAKTSDQRKRIAAGYVIDKIDERKGNAIVVMVEARTAASPSEKLSPLSSHPFTATNADDHVTVDFIPLHDVDSTDATIVIENGIPPGNMN